MAWPWKRGETKEHKYTETRLSAYLDDELSPQEKERVDRHLAACADCRRNLKTLRQTVQWTRELPPVPVPRVFTLPASVQPVRRQRRRGFVPALQGAAALVALMLILVVTGDVLRFGPMREAAPLPQAVKLEAPLEEKAVEIGAGAAGAPTAVSGAMVEKESKAAEAVPPTAPPRLSLSVLETPPADTVEGGAPPASSAPRALAGPPPTPTLTPFSTTPLSPTQKPEAEAQNRPAEEPKPQAAVPPALPAVHPLRLVEWGLGLILLLLMALMATVMLRRR